MDISRDLDARSRDIVVFTFRGIAKKDLAEELTKTWNSLVTTLIEEEEVQKLRHEIQNMKNARHEITEMVLPVKLKQLISHSRCGLCPV